VKESRYKETISVVLREKIRTAGLEWAGHLKKLGKRFRRVLKRRIARRHRPRIQSCSAI
jgi:hypothetical protein